MANGIEATISAIKKMVRIGGFRKCCLIRPLRDLSSPMKVISDKRGCLFRKSSLAWSDLSEV
jgi:hypothetical protein